MTEPPTVGPTSEPTLPIDAPPPGYDRDKRPRGLITFPAISLVLLISCLLMNFLNGQWVLSCDYLFLLIALQGISPPPRLNFQPIFVWSLLVAAGALVLEPPTSFLPRKSCSYSQYPLLYYRHKIGIKIEFFVYKLYIRSWNTELLMTNRCALIQIEYMNILIC